MDLAKVVIGNISATVIVYRGRNPSEVFMEVKDHGYPFPNFKGRYCIIGGNWVGNNARADKNPRETMCREVREEITFDRPVITSDDLEDLEFGSFPPYISAGISAVSNEGDRTKLEELRNIITEGAVAWKDCLQSVPTEVHNGERPGSTTLCSYWHVGLGENEWGRLLELQSKFGNLSNESLTILTSVDEMIREGLMGTWGHDQALRSFLIEMGVARAESLPCLPGITLDKLHPPLNSYDDYLARYDVKKNPRL